MFSADFKLCPKPQNIRLHHLLHQVWFVLLSYHFGQPFCCSLQHSLNPVSSREPGFTFHGLDVILKRLMRTPFEPLFVCILIFFFFTHLRTVCLAGTVLQLLMWLRVLSVHLVSYSSGVVISLISGADFFYINIYIKNFSTCNLLADAENLL